jgi:hypothetical protein
MLHRQSWGHARGTSEFSVDIFRELSQHAPRPPASGSNTPYRVFQNDQRRVRPTPL